MTPRKTLAFACLAVSGCGGSPYSAPVTRDAKIESKRETAGTPRFVAGSVEGPLPAAIAREVRAALADHERALVYVGAAWCEPCQRFHDALDAGELDQALGGVRFVEFDSDRDGARLNDAGYGGRMIPRFVVPDANGRGTEAAVEGSVKGPAAVDHIMRRLGPLLAR